MTRCRLSRIFWIGAAAILVVAALVALTAVLRGSFSDTDGRILLTLAALLYTGGAGVAGLGLADREPARRLGIVVAAAAPVALALVVWAVWSFVWEDDNEPEARIAWSAVLVLLAGLLASVALLLARRPALVRLAGAAGVLAALAAALSVAGVWAEPEGDAFVKAVGAAWILTVLAFFLVPVLQRFSNVGVDAEAPRVLGVLGGVELVAARGRVDGVEVAAPDPGERLYLRARS